MWGTGKEGNGNYVGNGENVLKLIPRSLSRVSCCCSCCCCCCCSCSYRAWPQAPSLSLPSSVYSRAAVSSSSSSFLQPGTCPGSGPPSPLPWMLLSPRVTRPSGSTPRPSSPLSAMVPYCPVSPCPRPTVPCSDCFFSVVFSVLAGGSEEDC